MHWHVYFAWFMAILTALREWLFWCVVITYRMNADLKKVFDKQRNFWYGHK